jgi:hypothetical protein
MRKIFVPVLLAVACLLPRDALAVFVNYSVDQSTYGLAVSVPFPAFEVTAGGLLIIFSDGDEPDDEDPELQIVDGPVYVEGRFTIDVGTGPGADLGLSGTIDVDFRNALGTLTGNSLAVTIGTLAVVGTIFCDGDCNLPSRTDVRQFSDDVGLSGAVDPLGAPSVFRASLPLDVEAIQLAFGSPVPLSLEVVANETDRNVPEPGAVVLLLTGAAGLARWGRQRAA